MPMATINKTVTVILTLFFIRVPVSPAVKNQFDPGNFSKPAPLVKLEGSAVTSRTFALFSHKPDLPGFMHFFPPITSPPADR